MVTGFGMFQKAVTHIFETAGISFQGTAPWDIEVRHTGFYRRVLLQGSLGLGESYMDGWWDCAAVDQLFERLLGAGLHRSGAALFPEARLFLTNLLYNTQRRRTPGRVVQRHYNPESRVILSFLDPYNQYSCGYFDGTDDLAVAQEKKLDLICRKLHLSPRDRVLDIGCGWGGFARYAAERYGCHVTGISTSGEQLAFARRFCRGLPVAFRRLDYRDLSGRFDKVLVCGMIEHVGRRNYGILMEKVRGCLDGDGLFLLQTIGGNDSVVSNDPWIEKYFYPDSMLPSLRQIAGAAEKRFVVEDLHNLGPHYAPTLMAWHRNFRARREDFLDRNDERGYRMWEYFFLHLAGAFRARKNQLWQIVFSRRGEPGGLPLVR